MLTQQVRALLADYNYPVNPGLVAWRDHYRHALLAGLHPSRRSCGCVSAGRCHHLSSELDRRLTAFEIMLMAGPLDTEAADGLLVLNRLELRDFNIIEVGNATGDSLLYLGKLLDTGTGVTTRVYRAERTGRRLEPHDLLPTATEAASAYTGPMSPRFRNSSPPTGVRVESSASRRRVRPEPAP